MSVTSTPSCALPDYSYHQHPTSASHRLSCLLSGGMPAIMNPPAGSSTAVKRLMKEYQQLTLQGMPVKRLYMTITDPNAHSQELRMACSRPVSPWLAQRICETALVDTHLDATQVPSPKTICSSGMPSSWARKIRPSKVACSRRSLHSYVSFLDALDILLVVL